MAPSRCWDGPVQMLGWPHRDAGMVPSGCWDGPVGMLGWPCRERWDGLVGMLGWPRRERWDRPRRDAGMGSSGCWDGPVRMLGWPRRGRWDGPVGMLGWPCQERWDGPIGMLGWPRRDAGMALLCRSSVLAHSEGPVSDRHCLSWIQGFLQDFQSGSPTWTWPHEALSLGTRQVLTWLTCSSFVQSFTCSESVCARHVLRAAPEDECGGEGHISVLRNFTVHGGLGVSVTCSHARVATGGGQLSRGAS